MPATAIHLMVERCREGRYPAVIARLSSGWAIMGERQVLPGYCLLLPDPVVPDLNALQGAERAAFLADMSLLGDALLVSTAAARINYAIFGNVEPALHAHVFPRHAAEPEAIRTAQPWALDWQGAPSFSPAAHGDLQRRLAARLRQPSVMP
jgi:diadenosine tetraphosphate (Ap4A) HIT family hydrolase